MNKISHSVSKIENLETVAENPCISGHKKKKSFNGSCDCIGIPLELPHFRQSIS